MYRRAGGRRAAALLAVAVVAAVTPAGGAEPSGVRPRVVTFQGESGLLPDVDARTAVRAPLRTARADVRALGGTARWTRFGTVHSLIDHTGYLGHGLTGDPSAAARGWIHIHRDLFRLSPAGVDALEVLNVSPLGDGGAHVVLFRQRFGDVPAAQDGLITLAIDPAGRLVYVSSSSAGDGNSPEPPVLSHGDALRAAAVDVDVELPAIPVPARTDREWKLYELPELSEPARVRLRAFPTVEEGVRPVWETLLIDNDHRRGHPIAFTHFVDARTGSIWWRQSRLNFQEEPQWRVFDGYPPLSFKTNDTRELWCWRMEAGCDRAVKNNAAMAPWDEDVRSGAPTFTTAGNAAISGQSWASPFTPAEPYRPVAPDRRYDFEWTNQWYEENCSPAAFVSPQRVDIDAATANLFAMHNRMHDYAYELGFTESNYNLQVVNGENTGGRDGDPEIGNAQAGAGPGSLVPLVGRDNANQITPQDGIPPITNMYLWQPVAAAFYPPCVDGDYDMAVIGHEYTHAISNRMVAGPDAGLSGAQAGAMGESWSDLVAAEYLNSYGFVPVGRENPWSVGAYVTGDFDTAVRNYGMNRSPLNYSNIGYDLVGPQVHADGEIWSALNFEMRSLLNRKYDGRFPSRNRTLQTRCNDGKRNASRCAGNRRWIQIVFDAFLLMPSQVSMVDARDAYLAADRARFGGQNLDELWLAFARRGLGRGAKSNGTGDSIPTPSFRDPRGPNGNVTFRFPGDGAPDPGDVTLFVGDYEARSRPVGDAGGGRGLTVTLAPGRYEFLARAPGYGFTRFAAHVVPGSQTVVVPMERNLASSDAGASATGDGTNHGALIDDTEMTNWTSDDVTVEGKGVIVDLAGGVRRLDRVQVSAMLLPGQNRFSALRQFRIQVCTARGGTNCDAPDDFRNVYTSRRNAFPVVPPRPKAPHLILRSFNIPNVTATHVRLEVVHNQCTGVKAFREDTDADPTNDGSCLTGIPGVVSPQGGIVRAAELQVFGR